MSFDRLRTGFLAIALGVAGLGGAFAQDYSFTATNSTDSAIKEILVSQNGTDWGRFDIGAGIEPGTTVNLVWAKSTNNEACKQQVKAVFADGSESEPAEFDFCEAGLELDF